MDIKLVDINVCIPEAAQDQHNVVFSHTKYIRLILRTANNYWRGNIFVFKYKIKSKSIPSNAVIQLLLNNTTKGTFTRHRWQGLIPGDVPYLKRKR